MKTLLLTLVVVAFVYISPGCSRICHSCIGKLCYAHEECKEGQDLCFERKYKDDLFGMKTVRGCADTCSNPGEKEEITYCAYDKCNC